MGDLQTLVPNSFDCPNGTISVEILQRRRMIRIFAEPVVDPYDWLILRVVLQRFNLCEPVFLGPFPDHGVDVWFVPLTGVGVSL